MDLPERVEIAISRVRREKISYLGGPALRNLAAAVTQIDRRALDGAIVECGTALGGSAIVMAVAKAASRPMKLYDMFSMIPPPTEEDGADVLARYETIVSGSSSGIGGDTYYGYHEDLLAEVTASFERFGVPVASNAIELIPGDFSDTLKVDFPVAIAHLDGDWYESTRTCLERLVPHLVPGGRLIVDDYDYWHGCQKAVDEFFAGRQGFEFVRKRRLHIIRRP